MGRTVLSDESVQNYTTNLIKNGQWYIGLIIGQLTSQKDYVVRLIRTPEPAEDECSEEEDDSSKPARRKKSENKPESLADIDDHWISTHAKQVTRMLPGGLDVIGVFAIAPPNMMKAAQNKIRQVFYSMQKTLKKLQLITNESDINDRILLQICTETRKYTCKSIDVSDPKSTFRPADWKTQGFSEKWIKLKTHLTFKLNIDVPVSSQNQTFLKRIQSGIIPYCMDLAGAMATINGQLRNNDEILDQSQGESKKTKGKDKGQTTPQQEYGVAFLMQPSTSLVKDPQICECGSNIVLQGCIYGQAYVCGKSTVGEAIKAMATDLTRSLIARCELLCEDIDVVEEDTVIKELYDTPVRVFGKLPNSSLEFCDYRFQDEKFEEVAERINELLDLPITEDQLDFSRERVATEEDWSEGKKLEESESSVPHEASNKIVNTGLRIGAAVAGFVAMIVAGASYLFLGDGS